MSKEISELFKEYERELVECLEKFDVKALDEFIEKWFNKSIIDGSVYSSWFMTSSVVKQATMCKMIANHNKVSKKTKEKARKWLKENQFSQAL